MININHQFKEYKRRKVKLRCLERRIRGTPCLSSQPLSVAAVTTCTHPSEELFDITHFSAYFSPHILDAGVSCEVGPNQQGASYRGQKLNGCCSPAAVKHHYAESWRTMLGDVQVFTCFHLPSYSEHRWQEDKYE